MRAVIAIIAGFSLLLACAKQKTKDPIPKIGFVDFANPGTTATGGDTATLILTYEDGDGDIFVDANSDRANLVFTPYHYDPTTKKFIAGHNPDPNYNDTIRHVYTVKQPDNGYYKGKSIRGEVYVPMTSFRENNKQRILKFSGFMVDMTGHKSNVFSSPSYTLDF